MFIIKNSYISHCGKKPPPAHCATPTPAPVIHYYKYNIYISFKISQRKVLSQWAGGGFFHSEIYSYFLL